MKVLPRLWQHQLSSLLFIPLQLLKCIQQKIDVSPLNSFRFNKSLSSH